MVTYGIIASSTSSSSLKKRQENMYKNVLLTDHEIKLLRKVLHDYLRDNLIETTHTEVKNLHIIDRTLLGKKPTLNTVN